MQDFTVSEARSRRVSQRAHVRPRRPQTAGEGRVEQRFAASLRAYGGQPIAQPRVIKKDWRFYRRSGPLSDPEVHAPVQRQRFVLRKELDITMALAGETNIANVGHHNLLEAPATARKVQQAKAESAATTTKKPAGAKPKTATKPKSAAKPRAAAAKSASAPKRQTPANRPAATRSKSAAKS